MNFLKSIFKFSWEFVKILVAALILAGLIRYFVIQPFFIEGASMEPNFDNGEYLVIDELSYYFRNAERGEVVVFHYPLNTSKYYIKRVIGLPGETIEIRNGQVIIYNKQNPDGFAVKENYLASNILTEGQIKKKLSDNEYFVLGDNRENSSDSRYWGTLPKNDVVGRAWLRILPLNRLDVFKKPNYVPET